MITLLKQIPLKILCSQPVMFDANIFMVGIENRGSDPNCSFENMKDIYMIPIFESFRQIIIHQMVYDELDNETKAFVDTYIGKNVIIVQEKELYGKDPLFTTIFNDIANHERVQYSLGSSKDRGEVYSLAYAAYHNINYFSSKEIMVDDIVKELETLQNIEVITFDIIILLAYIYHMSKGDTSKNKALKSIYKRYCEDVIKRHKLPHTLREYFIASEKYIR